MKRRPPALRIVVTTERITVELAPRTLLIAVLALLRLLDD